jgi:hypothetical protein
MKNIKTGNILLIAFAILIGFFILNGGIRDIKNIFTEELKEQIVEKDKQLEILKDSLKTMHISYMNDSYAKENFNKDVTYWFVRHSHSKFRSQNIIKFDGPFSPTDLVYKIYKHDKVSGFVGIDYVEQVSEKEYYKWLEFEALEVNYIPY